MSQASSKQYPKILLGTLAQGQQFIDPNNGELFSVERVDTWAHNSVVKKLGETATEVLPHTKEVIKRVFTRGSSTRQQLPKRLLELMTIEERRSRRLQRKKELNARPELRQKTKQYAKIYRAKPEVKAARKVYRKLTKSIIRHRANRYGTSFEVMEKLLSQSNCDLCGKPLEESLQKRHIDHDHITNQIRGVLHPNCNFALGRIGDNYGGAITAARYLDPFTRSPLAIDSGEAFLEQLDILAVEDVEGLKKAFESYGPSFKMGGGINTFFMLKRKWDRLFNRLEKPEINYDIFKAIAVDTRGEGIIDDIRDLRRYLFLVEAEMRARGFQRTHRDNLPGNQNK